VVLRIVDDSSNCPEPPLLSSVHPLYAVDLDQRITSWNGAASEQFRASEDVIGRRCYEVLASIDQRNAALCRPNCPVVTQARAGRPAPDFEVWAETCGGGAGRVQVSILLQQAEDPAQTRVIHMVRPVEERSAPLPMRELPRLLRSGKRHADPAHGDLRNAITPRQAAALRLLAEGASPEEIAESLGVRPITIRNHIQAAMDRLGARTRLEAVILASRAGLLDDAP
jgi:DNA-binding CsgD family transcriptional regulator